MKSTTVRRTALSIAAVAALTSVAACGSSSGSGGSGKGDKAAGGSTIHISPIAAVLRNVEQSTDKAESAKVRSTMSIGDLMSVAANGTMRWGNGLQGSLNMSYTGGRLAEAMRKAGAATSIQARYLPDAYYANMGDAGARQMGGKHWLKYSYDDLAKFGGASGAYTKDQLRNATPKQSVQMLLASGDVKKVGEETVSGARATHYSGTVNVADFAGRSSSLTADQLSALKQQLSQTGITTETIDIWVNDQNLPVKKTEKANTAKGLLTNTAYYSDFGVPVSAEAPPAADTKDFKDLMKSLGTPGSGNVASGSATAS
ncbi:hypothetical protein [Streptomyces broussonetiae]|uniref:Lipoprotein n=1 Tax=Streptomyces broussonetiae TaxID=2686304 RepID=A0A6I6NBE7_9ACTN|nr:hypothetical protein [Streptomyces broussonetiae]QHA06265.1 hypothetical protein GQF42_25970 [Streptomyces broussonetiae]